MMNEIHQRNNFYLKFLSMVIILTSIIMFSINKCCYRFPGLFYFEPSFLELCLLLYMLRSGLKLQFGLRDDLAFLKFLKEASIYSFIIVLLIFSTSAIQYTPFQPIDKQILEMEKFLHLDLKASITWLAEKKEAHRMASFIYESVGYQVLIFPLWVMLCRKYSILYEFYFLVLISWLIGSLVYYLFPTTAPASVIDSHYFIESQRATGLKFWQLHHYIQPVTEDGGMVAMPSFHVIWGWLSVYILRPWPILFSFMLIINAIMSASCVLLGWHYFLDIIGSIVTIIFSHAIYFLCHKSPQQQTSSSLVENTFVDGETFRDFHPL